MSSNKSVGAAFILGIGVLTLLAGLWLYGVFAYGFVLAKMWTWFVMPIGASVLDAVIKPIGIIQASAICTVVRFVLPSRIKIDSTDERPTSDKVTEIFVIIIAPWLALFFAYLLKGMM